MTKVTALGDSLTKGVILTEANKYSLTENSYLDIVSRELGSKPIIISLPPILSTPYFSFFSRLMSEEQKKNVINWLGGSTDIISRWHESYNRALFMIAKETQTPIIDITTPFDTFRGDISSLYCADGIHPNAQGHRMIAATIINSYL